jgi:predicted O-methyltransferase YrrM
MRRPVAIGCGVVGLTLIFILLHDAVGTQRALGWVISMALLALGVLVAADGLWRLHSAQAKRQMDEMVAMWRIAAVGDHALVGGIRPQLGRHSLEASAILRILEMTWHRDIGLIVELGSGSSTRLLAAGIRLSGSSARLVSVEHDSEWADLVASQVAESGLDDIVCVVHAPLEPDGTRRHAWYRSDGWLDNLGTIDVLIVDGPPRVKGHDVRHVAIDLLAHRVAPGGLVLIDDINRRSEKRLMQLWMVRLGAELVWRSARSCILRMPSAQPSSQTNSSSFPT